MIAPKAVNSGTKQICFMGFNWNYEPIKLRLEEKFDLNISTFETAAEGIDSLKQKKYNIILLDDMTPSYGLAGEYDARDQSSRNGFLIRKIREVEKETPLVMLYIPTGTGRLSREVVAPAYLGAGATAVHEWTGIENNNIISDPRNSGLVRLMMQHMPIKDRS